MLSILFEMKKMISSFKTVGLIKNHVRKLLINTKKNVNIDFDLENNDPIDEVKEYIVQQNYWTTSICKFKYQMYQAGGDWEIPVYYFVCQLISGYAKSINCYDDTCGFFIYIPSKTKGNYHLIPNNKGDGWSAPHDSTYKKNIDPEPNKEDCILSLKEYLKKLVYDEINEVKIAKLEKEEFKIGESDDRI